MTAPVVDRDLVDGWVEGWARCRGARVHRLAGDLARVDVADRHRAAELILWPAPPARVAEVAAEWVGRPRHWLTLLGAGAAVAAPDGWRVRTADEVVMTTALSPPRAGQDAQRQPGPAGPVTIRKVGLDVVRAEVGDGGSVASGLVGVVGELAVFDQVATDPSHRRQGHSRAVMEALAAAARDSGAGTGVLLASVEGQALYTSLGWAVAAPLLSLEPDVPPLRERLRTGLRDALKVRDRPAVAAIRSALAAVDNAEAVPLDPADPTHRAGAVEASAVGLGAAEVARRELTEADVANLLLREVRERREAVAVLVASAPERAATVRAEADVLAAFLG